ncbi:MAG: hypothetical protein EBX19_08060 [Actinobacteria bacterium]|nr:hypothetical protein [Actinomycetota bacterium]
MELDGSNDEVIFRGHISKVSNDTSSGQQNLIKVDCSSMMAYLKQAPFVPAWGAVTTEATRRSGRIYQDAQNDVVIQTVLKTDWKPEVFGARFDPLSPEVGATVVNLWQVRQEGKGGINVPLPESESPGVITVPNEVLLNFDGEVTASNNSFLMCFDAGFYDSGGDVPEINLRIGTGRATEASIFSPNRPNSRSWYSDATVQSATVKGENCVESIDFPTLIAHAARSCRTARIARTTHVACVIRPRRNDDAARPWHRHRRRRRALRVAKGELHRVNMPLSRPGFERRARPHQRFCGGHSNSVGTRFAHEAQ